MKVIPSEQLRRRNPQNACLVLGGKDGQGSSGGNLLSLDLPGRGDFEEELPAKEKGLKSLKGQWKGYYKGSGYCRGLSKIK